MIKKRAARIIILSLTIAVFISACQIGPPRGLKNELETLYIRLINGIMYPHSSSSSFDWATGIYSRNYRTSRNDLPYFLRQFTEQANISRDEQMKILEQIHRQLIASPFTYHYEHRWLDIVYARGNTVITHSRGNVIVRDRNANPSDTIPVNIETTWYREHHRWTIVSHKEMRR